MYNVRSKTKRKIENDDFFRIKTFELDKNTVIGYSNIESRVSQKNM